MRFLNSAIAIIIITLFALMTMQTASAELPSPYFVYKVAVDDAGNIYALVSGNDSISYNIHVYAPDGREIKAINTSGRSVQEIAFDGEGNLYLRDASYDKSPAQSIRKIDRTGNETIIDSANRSDNVILLGLAVSHDGTLYYGKRTPSAQYPADSNLQFDDYSIQRVSPDGNRIAIYAVNDSSGFTSLAVDAKGTIYACDAISITAIFPDGNTSIINRIGPGDSPINLAGSISIGPDGYLYTAEYSSAIGAGRVRKLDTNGTAIAQWPGCGPNPFVTATSVAVDKTGRIYVADLHNQRIVWLTGDYRFGDNQSQNLAGKDVHWGTVVQGYDYKTWAAMAEQENQQPLYPLIAGILLGCIIIGALAYMLIWFYASGRSLSMAGNAIVLGISALVISAISMIFILILWSGIHSVFGYSYTSPVDRYLSAAQSAQIFSMIFLLLIGSGALASYAGRKHIRDDTSALIAGALTGLCFVGVFYIFAIATSLIPQLTAPGISLTWPNFLVRFTELTYLNFVRPAIVVMPLTAFGAYLCRQYLAWPENTGRQAQKFYAAMTLAILLSIIYATLMVTDVLAMYEAGFIAPLLFTLPLIVTLPVLAGGLKMSRKIGSVPLLLILATLSVITINIVPLAGILLASTAGVI